MRSVALDTLVVSFSLKMSLTVSVRPTVAFATGVAETRFGCAEAAEA